MMNKIYKHVLVASLLMMGGTAMAQTLNSAYFTDDYKFRHDMNPAFENKQNYITLPALGNMNVNLQGNFGYQDIVVVSKVSGIECLSHCGATHHQQRGSQEMLIYFIHHFLCLLCV